MTSPAQADPTTIKQAQERVDTLYREAEQASERLNAARLEVKQIRRQLASLRADEKAQAELTDAAKSEAKDAMLRQYEGQDMSAVSSVVSSASLGDFLDQVSTMDSYSDVTDQLYADYSTQARALTLREKATERRVKRLATLQSSLADDKEEIDTKLAAAQSVLSGLKAAQREKLEAKQEAAAAAATSTAEATATTTTAKVSGSAAAVVAYAYAQLGDAYVYGASGPDAFDCSGLTMMAWAAAGVSLSHSSSAQYNEGTHVAESDLQPGDLVFYYSPISHVGIYIGNGQVIDAANPSTGVRVTTLHSMPYVGAVRPG
ncbi:hypothetical protein E8D37_13970 [Nocardioides sp. GY 10127]|nr:hypothetical protein E8D37_13970 [Nocardioides sp. GY 10127]